MPQTRRKTSDIASDSTPEPSLAAKKLPAQQRVLGGEIAVQRLMQRQNDCVARRVSVEVIRGGVPALEEALAELLLDTYAVTRDTPAGVWIMRAMRAVPALQEVRLASHAAVTEAQTRLLMKALPGAKRAELKLASRIVVELIYATVEMLFDESLKPKEVARIAAGMMASHLAKVMR